MCSRVVRELAEGNTDEGDDPSTCSGGLILRSATTPSTICSSLLAGGTQDNTPVQEQGCSTCASAMATHHTGDN